MNTKMVLEERNNIRELVLRLPEGSEEVGEISQDDEYDYRIHDLEVRINIPSLICGAKVMQEYRDRLKQVSTLCWADSESYEGKLRYEKVNVSYWNSGEFCFYLEIFNEYTGTGYELNLTTYIYDCLNLVEADNFIEKLELLLTQEF